MNGVHVGDGIYVTFDGAYWWLSAQREDRTHRVELNPTTLLNLIGLLVRTSPGLADYLRATIDVAVTA